MRNLARFVLVLMTVGANLARAQEWNCQTPECQGHKAGYDWGLSHPITEEDCDAAGQHYNSPSFAEGCRSAVVARRQYAAVRAALVPLFEAFAYGQQVAKENRALPAYCQSAYEFMTGADASVNVDLSAAIGFKSGCLDVANKQAKRIMKEDQKRAKGAAKQAAKQAKKDAKANP